MANRINIFILMILFLLSIGGCAPFQNKIRQLTETPKEEYTRKYLKKARKYEKTGDLVGALKHYKLAIAVNSDNHEAVKNCQRVEKTLHILAEEHYKKGLNYHKQGKYIPAKIQFLSALRLWPDYPEAEKMLTNRKRLEIKRYIVHEIQPGESLAKLAALYYGDYHRFSVIAEYNHITDATVIKSGEKIEVPEIEGIRLPGGPIQIKNEERALPDPGLSAWEEVLSKDETDVNGKEIQNGQDSEATESQITFYRDQGLELFSEERYRDALDEFAKVLNIYPEDEVTLDYCFKSHYQIAKSYFAAKDYIAAREQFKKSLQYNENCNDCRSNIENSENLYKEENYIQGMQFYGNEQLKEAIEKWELVAALDPGYKQVDDLIIKANTILKKLEAIRAAEEMQK